MTRKEMEKKLYDQIKDIPPFKFLSMDQQGERLADFMDIAWRLHKVVEKNNVGNH